MLSACILICDHETPTPTWTDTVNILGVNIGFGGQQFQEQTLEKIGHVRATLVETRGGGAGVARAAAEVAAAESCVVMVDGGINEMSARACTDAGATALVAGTCPQELRRRRGVAGPGGGLVMSVGDECPWGPWKSSAHVCPSVPMCGVCFLADARTSIRGCASVSRSLSCMRWHAVFHLKY